MATTVACWGIESKVIGAVVAFTGAADEDRFAVQRSRMGIVCTQLYG